MRNEPTKITSVACFFSMQNKTVSRITLTSSEIKEGFEGYFYWRKVKSFQKDGDTRCPSFNVLAMRARI